MNGIWQASLCQEKVGLLNSIAEIYTATQHEFSHCVSTCLSATGFNVGEHSGRGAVLKAKCFFFWLLLS